MQSRKIKTYAFHHIKKNFLSKVIKPTYGRDRIKFRPIHACVQSYAVSFVPSVINQWNKVPVAMLNVDDTKTFENSIFEFYRLLLTSFNLCFNMFVFQYILVLNVVIS